jgi:hypothetical protein
MAAEVGEAAYANVVTAASDAKRQGPKLETPENDPEAKLVKATAIASDVDEAKRALEFPPQNPKVCAFTIALYACAVLTCIHCGRRRLQTTASPAATLATRKRTNWTARRARTSCSSSSTRCVAP